MRLTILIELPNDLPPGVDFAEEAHRHLTTIPLASIAYGVRMVQGGAWCDVTALPRDIDGREVGALLVAP